MQGLKKKLNSFINASIGLSVFFSILGFLFLQNNLFFNKKGQISFQIFK